MPRPKKEKHLKFVTDLRIPVTLDQKAIITAITSSEPQGMAAWARGVLLKTAQELIEQREEVEKNIKRKS